MGRASLFQVLSSHAGAEMAQRHRQQVASNSV